MTTLGMAFMAVCWAGIIGFTLYFFHRTLSVPQKKD